MVVHEALHDRSPLCPEATPAPSLQTNRLRHHRQFARRNPVLAWPRQPLSVLFSVPCLAPPEDKQANGETEAARISS